MTGKSTQATKKRIIAGEKRQKENESIITHIINCSSATPTPQRQWTYQLILAEETNIDLKKLSPQFYFEHICYIEALSCMCLKPSMWLTTWGGSWPHKFHLCCTDVCHLSIYLQHFYRPQQSALFQIQRRLTSLSMQQHCRAAGGQENQSNDYNLSKCVFPRVLAEGNPFVALRLDAKYRCGLLWQMEELCDGVTLG